MIIKILSTILVILFTIRTIRNTFFLTMLWQVKEYRLDRFWVHLAETAQGRQLLIGKRALIKWGLLIFYPLTYFNNLLNTLFLLAVVFVYIGEVSTIQFKRPVFTIKAVAIIFISLFLQFLLFNLPLFDIFYWVLIVDKVLPLIVFGAVLFFSLPTEFSRDRAILEAATLLRRRKKLVVIGVTGSYGKSSTKEFIAQVLSYKFKVLKTAGSQNTPIGVAKTIINGLKKDTQVLVVEMGAYKIGEINQVCQIVTPTIGVLTGISSQHLSLFGSINKTIEGKYELIESLPKKDGLAIFNGENTYCRQLYKKTKIKKLIYGFDSSDITVRNIKVSTRQIEFEVMLGSKRQQFSANLLGQHNIENLLPAILVAHHLGMTLSEIAKAVEQLSSLPLTLQPTRQFLGATLLDDTFNASQEGTLAAFEYMKFHKNKRKILVFTPMIELGREAGKIHEQVGKKAGDIFDMVFLTNNNFAQSFANGLKRGNKKTNLHIIRAKEIKEMLTDILGKNDVVLFEGKEAGTILRVL